MIDYSTFTKLETQIKRRVLVLDGALGTMIQQYNLTESDFKFTAVTIDDDLTSDDICSAYDSLLAKAAPDAKPESRKVFRANCLYEKGDGGQLSLSARLREKGMEDIQVAVYTIDGKPYIIF